MTTRNQHMNYYGSIACIQVLKTTFAYFTFSRYHIIQGKPSVATEVQNLKLFTDYIPYVK